MDFLATMRGQMQEFFSKLTRGQLIRLVVLIVGVIAVAIVAISLLGRTTYAELYQSTDPAEMGRINTYLKEQNVPTRVEGNTLSVPEKQRDALRWDLAMNGYFDGGGYTTDIKDKGLGIGTTESAERSYDILQTAYNLERTIEQSPKIKKAYVMLYIAERSNYLISKDNEASSASVMLIRNEPLTEADGDTIRALVRGAHSSLNDKNINIVDDDFNLYMPIDASEMALTLNADRLGMQAEIEKRLQNALIELFTPVFGANRVQAVVSVELDFDKRTQQEIVFAPPVEGEITGIPIAIQELSETIKGSTNLAQGEPGLDENGGAPSYVESELAGTDNIYSKTSKNTNMEVNETKTMIESAQGAISFVTAAIIIPADDASEDFTTQVRELAAKALGLKNIDNVTVERMPLQEPTDYAARFDALKGEAQKYEMQRLLIILSAIVLVTLLMLLALRTVLKALRPPAPVQVTVEPSPAELSAAAAAGQLVDVTTPEDGEGIGGAGLTVATDEDGEADEDGEEADDASQYDALFDDTRVEDNTLSQVQRFIDKDPESVAQLLRNWLTDDFR